MSEDARPEALSPPLDGIRKRHIAYGWWMLLVFLCLGMGLDVLHGLKVRAYLDVSHATRRLMWTLAHAHGTLIAFVHFAFAAFSSGLNERARMLASKCLIASSLLLPGGFFLGGLATYSGDPGVGALAVPIGGVLLIVAVGIVARGSTR